MSAGNDDFIRRRICDVSLGQPGGEGNFIHRRSLSQMWAAVTAEVSDYHPEPKAGEDVAGYKNPKETNEQ